MSYFVAVGLGFGASLTLGFAVGEVVGPGEGPAPCDGAAAGALRQYWLLARHAPWSHRLTEWTESPAGGCDQVATP